LGIFNPKLLPSSQKYDPGFGLFQIPDLGYPVPDQDIFHLGSRVRIRNTAVMEAAKGKPYRLAWQWFHSF
jgi:hypothetical protein